MTAFDRAWDILKMPWFFQPQGSFGRSEEPIVEGPLYSGGDRSDTPTYWTDDLNEALAYALFGSAVPRDDLPPSRQDDFASVVPMRQTVPQIFIAREPQDPDPEWDYVRSDPYSEAYMKDDMDYDRMDEAKMRELLLSLIEGGDDMFMWGNTGTSHSPEARQQHIADALRRFDTGVPGRLVLPDEAKHLSATSETDEMMEDDQGSYDLEDYEEWGFQ